MRQYPVPQFIEREAKITFFLTFKQFIALIVIGIIDFIIYQIFPRSLSFIIIAVISVGGISLFFIKIGGQPLTTYLMNYLGFLRGGKKYVWSKKRKLLPQKKIKKISLEELNKENLSLKVASKKSELDELKKKIQMKSR